MSCLRGLAIITLAASASLAQGTPPRPVEPGKADVDPLSTSQKLEPIDLRVPTGFDRVYELRVPPKGPPIVSKPGSAGDSPGRANDRWFVRQSGALAVVFKHSLYTSTPRGVLAELPPGAIFGIGGVTPTLLAQIQAQAEPPREPTERAITPAQRTSAAAPLRPTRVNRAAQPARAAGANEPTPPSQGTSQSVGGPASPMPSRPSIWIDEAYRRTRLGELIDEAREAEPKRADAAD